MQEIVQIARRIPRVWTQVALLTSLFETYEIDEIRSSTVNEDGTGKAIMMLTHYVNRKGTRQRLAGALEKLRLTLLSQNVRSGSFIDTGEEE